MADGKRGFTARLSPPAALIPDDHYSSTASSPAVTAAAATAVVVRHLSDRPQAGGHLLARPHSTSIQDDQEIIYEFPA
jgi:hypothetical protein